MRKSKLIPFFIAIFVIAIIPTIGMGSFASKSDFDGATSARHAAFPYAEYSPLGITGKYNSLKVGDVRPRVEELLESDGFVKVLEIAGSNHYRFFGVQEERDAHNIIIFERSFASEAGHKSEVLEIIFRYERFSGMFKEGLAYTPDIYLYEVRSAKNQ